MVYFEHILEGNIPTRILTTILNSAPHLKTQLNLDHYQINDFNKKEISYKTIMNSCYGKLIMTSLKLNRLNISNGLKNMFKDALYMAISKNSNKINQLKGLPSPNNVLLNQIVNSIVTDFTKSIEEVVKKIQLSCHEKEIILSILHLTGITNKNSHKIKNVKSKLRLNLELPKDLGNFSSIDIMSSIKQMMTYNNINVCKNSSLDKCIFTDTYLNKLTEYFLRSLDEIFNQIINYVKVHHFLEIYSLSITLLDYFAKYNLKKVEKLDNTQYEDNNLEVENLDNTQYEDNNLEVENLDNTQYEDNNLEVENLDNTQYEDNNLEVENLDNTQYEDNNLEVENLDNTQYEDNNLEVENLDNTQYEDNNLEVENLDNTQYEEEKSAEYFARYNLATIENLINLDNDEYNLIENMAIDIGGKTKLVDNTTIKQLNEMETNIDQSKVISGITKMLGKVITNVVSRNKGDLMRTLAISNNLNITSATGTSFSFKKVNQSVKIDSNVQANIVQNITNKIQNDVVNEVKTVIDSSTKEMKKSLDTKVINEEKGSTIGEVANSFFDAVKDVLKVSIGNNLDKSKGTEISNETKEKLNLNQSFKVNKPDDVDTAFENVLKPENLASCIAKTDAGNKIDLGKIDVTGAVTIEDVTQVAVLNDVMSCAFNQTVLTDISSKILNNFNKLIKNMVENISDKVTKEERSTITGDIALLGTAGKKILEGAGTAAEGVGKGVSTGAEGIGKGVGVAAEGIGKGISNMFGGLTNALIVGGIVMVVFGALFIYIKSRSSSASEEED